MADDSADFYLGNPEMEIQVEVNGTNYSQGQQLVVGDTLSFDVFLFAESGISYYLVNFKIGDGGYTSLQHNTPEILGIQRGTNSTNDQWDIVIDQSMSGESLLFYFELADMNELVATESLAFSVGS